MDQKSPTYSHMPRLYCAGSLQAGHFELSEGQAHYLRHVLRVQDGDMVRAFNQTDGEWAARLIFSGKKSVALQSVEKIRANESVHNRIHLLFSPIKKDRMDFLIEKSVELGVTHLHPLLMHRSVVRDIKLDRLQAQIIEAVEQCERLDVPQLHPLMSFNKFVLQFPSLYGNRILAALERRDAISLRAVSDQVKTQDQDQGQDQDIFYLVGPEGGFDAEEAEFLENSAHVMPVSLGTRILRAETAAIFGLSLLG
ncbi:MAG: RsmE family RNA methyltransferase [Pseudobdellovibrionaceae bacterium]|jgi:16S rRNA (uracil1498-N3)-methyltransferase|nr:RsmE family RNA methyltransferase [Pseudobdellovibrionaceae bacterium]